MDAAPISPDKFEILAITAGSANGWEFPAEVLRESLPLWEGVNCFVDHDWTSRSVRDIAGVLRKPVWDELALGIRAELHAFGPSADLLVRIGRQVLEIHDAPAVRVGFSADVCSTDAENAWIKSEDFPWTWYITPRGGMFCAR